MGLGTNKRLGLSECRWTKVMRGVLRTFIIILILLVAYVALGSRHFIKPISLAYKNNTLHYVREVPFGDVWARVAYEVRAPNVAACRPNTIPVIPFEDALMKEVLIRFPEEITPCIPVKDGGLFVLDIHRQVLLGGWFPLFPDRTVWSCRVGQGRCELVRG